MYKEPTNTHLPPCELKQLFYSFNFKLPSYIYKLFLKHYFLLKFYIQRLDALDDLTPGEIRESVDVEETLLVRVGAVNRVNMDWDFTEYRVDIRFV